MLKSCSYCGGIHDRKHQCSSKPKRKEKVTHVDRFRWTKAWQKKRKYIREDRDKHLCQVCIREMYNTEQKYNFTNIQVHHIVPIAEDYSKRLDDECLITLCSFHHSMAERDEISRQELLDIVEEQEKKNRV
jgi:5-methylcytosine-specific restriction endonuclease McrA